MPLEDFNHIVDRDFRGNPGKTVSPAGAAGSVNESGLRQNRQHLRDQRLREIPLLRDLLGTELHPLVVIFRKCADSRHCRSACFSVSEHLFLNLPLSPK